jgi:hypothetical protein
MFEPELFDTEYVVIGKTVAKSAGVLSGREVQSFFNMIQGYRNMDLYYNSNRVLIDWSNTWNAVDNIKSHSTFRVMPVDCVPSAILSKRLAQYNAMPSKPIAPSETGGNWFDQHTLRRADEGDTDFEYRMVRTLVVVFKTIKKL